MSRWKGFESGQVLLIVILAMTVALTVGLSIAARTITNLKLSKQNEESQKAFQAAESGVERAIKEGISSPINGSFTNNSNFTVTTQQIGYGQHQLNLNNGDVVTQDVGLDVWWSPTHDFNSSQSNTTNVIWYWGSSNQTQCTPGNGANTDAALEIITIRGSKAAPDPSKAVIDDCAGRTAGAYSTTFPPSGPNIQDGNFNVQGVFYRHKIQFGTGVNRLYSKVIPLYNSAIVAVETNPTGDTLPQQGTVINSTGKSGETVRKITYYSPYPQLPTEFFYAILSQ